MTVIRRISDELQLDGKMNPELDLFGCKNEGFVLGVFNRLNFRFILTTHIGYFQFAENAGAGNVGLQIACDDVDKFPDTVPDHFRC
jgi:hypothetical protein